MPSYTFYCNGCKNSFEVFCYIRDYIDRPRCISCNSTKTERQYTVDASTISSSIKKSDSELKTIGDLADRNRERMSDDHKQSLLDKHNAYKDTEATQPLPHGMSRIKKTKQKNQWRNL